MSVTEAKLKSIAPWFGGKRTMAPAIAAELGAHGSRKAEAPEILIINGPSYAS